jgi:ribonuclease-3
LRDLESKIGYRFRSEGLLSEAVRHASSRAEDASTASYERLEFLGDSVISLCVAEEVYRGFPEAGEGELSRTLHSIVSNRNLYELGCRIGIPDAMRTDRSVRSKGGGISRKMVADVVEALAGAIFLDGGFPAAREFVLRHLVPGGIAPEPAAGWLDAKTRLQELCQGNGKELPEYRVSGQSGPPHARTFRVEASALGLVAEGTGPSKKEAGMQAAAALLARIENREGRK